MKTALVYDWVVKWGGAERVLLALHRIFPQAPLYTSVYRPKTVGWAKNFEVKPSFLSRLPLRHEWLAPLMPLAFENFDFSGYDLVISITSAFAKGIITSPKTKHICYCLTPTRFLWSGADHYFGRFRPPLAGLRRWDQIAAQRPDIIIATCRNVQHRIKKYYKRKAEIIYPPVNTQKFEIRNSKLETNCQDYFLVVSRLVKYKRVDLAIKTFNHLGWPLKIIGTGREGERLKKIAGPNIEFLGQLTDGQLLGYYQTCRAVLCPQEEDFGLVPLEAQACGRPVVAFSGGGALETVVDGKTGLFFRKQTVKSLIKSLKGFKSLKFKSEDCRQNARRFDQKKFIAKIKRLTSEKQP